MKKTNIIVVLFLLSMLFMTACNNTKDAQKNETIKTQTTQDKKVTTSNEAKNKNDTSTKSQSEEPKDIVKIEFWHTMGGNYGKKVDEQVKIFNESIGKKEGIFVNAVQQQWPGTEKLMTAMSANDLENMPDIIQLSAEGVPLIKDYKNTVWAEEYITKSSSKLKKEDLLDSARSAYVLDEKMLGIPYAISALILYYNEDLLKQAGYEKAPSTIDELAKMLEDIKKIESVISGLNVKIDLYKFENFITTQGKNGILFGNNNNGHDGIMDKFTAGEEGYILSFLNEWDKVVKTNFVKTISEAENEEFAFGMNAMTIMSSSRIQNVNELVGNSMNWNVAPLPKVSSNDVGGANASGSGLYMLDRKKGNVEAAWKFIEYMASAENQVGWFDGFGYVPINKKVQNLDEFKNHIKNNPRLKIPFEILSKTPNTVIPSYIPNSSEVRRLIIETMEEFSNGKIDIQNTNEKLNIGIQKIIDEYIETTK